MPAQPFSQITSELFEREYATRHLLPAVVDHWAAIKPAEPAIINATKGTALTWAELDGWSRMLASELSRMGFRKGDRLACSMPLLTSTFCLNTPASGWG